MAADEYEALNEEADDPDVAFLSGSDDVEFRPGKSKATLQKPKHRRASKRLSQTMRPRPSRVFSPVLWIVLLCLLLGGLVIALIVILYHRSDDINRRTTFRQLQEDFSEEKSLFDGKIAASKHVESHGKSLSKGISVNESNCMWKNKRLPDTVAPISYDLNLQVDLVREKYTGSVKIEFEALMPTSLIILHAKNVAVSSAELRRLNGKNGEGEKLVIKHMDTCAELEQFELSLGNFLTEKFRYSLTLRFSANLSKSMDGFYVSHYRNATGHDRTLAATQFEPVYARSAFPCFDEPQLKAVFRVRILHDKDLNVVSNAPVESRSYSRVDPNRVETVFNATPLMSTYLLAFIVSDFTAVPGQKHPISIDLYVTPDKANQTSFALRAAPKVVDFFANFFDIPYPLQKLDLAAIPDFSAGAMENWGLITFRESALLYDPVESGLQQMDRVAIVVAHEIAHQWFGNLVTMAWWDQLWLTEGFAAFMEYLGASATNPELHIMLKHLDDIQDALALDSLLSTHPVVAAVDDPMEIAARFDDISYKKGSTILWMLYEALGPDVFRRGVTRYLKAHMYKNAETKALWEAMNEVWQNATDGETAGLTVENIANSWTIQPGFPLLTASRTPHGVKIVQERLVPFKEKTAFASKWYVPLSLVTSLGDQPEKSWMTDVETEISIPAMQHPEWYRLKQVGMYRVTYDNKNWKAISGALKLNHNKGFLPQDRATLVDDALSLSKYGLLNVTFALDVVSYLKKENHYLPRKSAEPYLRGLESLLYGTSSFPKFRKWRLEIVQPIFKQTNCTTENRNDVLSRRLCIQLFQEACYVGVEACVKLAMDIFNGLRKSNTRVPVDIRRSVYETAMRHGTEEDWDFLWERYQTTSIASEKDLILKALGATENMAKIKQLLRDALNESLVRQSDIFGIIGALSENLVARDQVWTAVRRNWSLFLKRYGIDSAIATFFMCLEWMSTQAELEEVKVFFEFPGRSLGAGLLAYKQMLETIGLHRKFLDLYQGDIDKWLNASVL